MESDLLDLLVHLLEVVMGLRTMGLSTTNPHGGGVLAGTSAAGTLLLPRLLATTANRGLILGLGSALALVVENSLDVEVHADRVDFFVKHLREFDIVLEIACCGEKLCTSH